MKNPPFPKLLSPALEAWFDASGHDYPWRRTRDPYAILVSEVMLQQTQIATVLDRGYYTRWMSRFPDFATLATAAEGDVLKAWEGLGYYRRARNLQKLAQIIVADHHGSMPTDPAQIRALPGIGPYTAGAISSFAFDLPEPIVDGNVARVIARLWNDPTPIDSTPGIASLWLRATDLVRCARSPHSLNSALMELGQRLCRPQQPDCPACPVRQHCTATRPASLPVKRKRTPLTEVDEHVAFHRHEDHVLLEQETGKRRTGLWKLPTLTGDPTATPVLFKSHYGITRYKVTLWVHQGSIAKSAPLPANHGWWLIPHLQETAMPSPYRRALKAALKVTDPFLLE